MSPRAQTLLIVDDSVDTLEVLQRHLEDAGFGVRCAVSVDEAIAQLEHARADLVITDLKMPGRSGLDLIRHVREHVPGTEILMVTGYPSVETAVAALKSGADDYLAKPFTAAELLAAVERALGKRRGLATALAPREEDTGRFGLVGQGDAMRAAFRGIEREAPREEAVLFVGEPGTGRQALARALHAAGARAAAPFVTLAGATIGAEGMRRTIGGLYAAAGDGTLFIDDAERLDRSAQDVFVAETKARAARREGRAGARLVASCSVDIAQPASRGRMVESFAAFFSGPRIEVPPLRTRREDVEILLRRFLAPAVPDDAAIAALCAYAWPGNLDEMHALCVRLATHGGTVGFADIPSHVRGAACGAAAALRPLAEVEREHILAVLDAVGGNRSRAAEILGIHRKTLREKVRGDD